MVCLVNVHSLTTMYKSNWKIASCCPERVFPQLHLGPCKRCIVYIASRLVYNVRVFFVPFFKKKQVQKPKMEADDLPQTLKLVCLLPRSNLTTFLETRPKRRLHTDRATCDLVAQPAAYVGWSALSRDHFWPYFYGCGAINTEIIKSGTDVKFMFGSRICS